MKQLRIFETGSSTRCQLIVAICLIGIAGCFADIASAQSLPPVPVPAENPITEAKRILGKILFWEEQLSYNDTVACGTCHIPGAGGADPRSGIHPGTDAGTIDNVRGSPGIASLDADGNLSEHEVFGFGPQITPRISPSNFGALWAAEVFWDGRAGPDFIDPLTEETAIAYGGALETQALAALSNSAEMTNSAHNWAALSAKLSAHRPLALAADIPVDVGKALTRHKTYPQLFEWAFGDSAITPVRIAFALATYQRTLIADATPWDRLQAGDSSALSETELLGWQDFQAFKCDSCHTPPLFTNNDFLNIGLRLSRFDNGRMTVTEDPEDAGEMKVPSLRNVGLRPRFMHTGQFNNLGAAIGFYRTGAALEDRDRMPNGSIYSFNMGGLNEQNIRAFLQNALTDPRVRDERFPFDRPKLRSEMTGQPKLP